MKTPIVPDSSDLRISSCNPRTMVAEPAILNSLMPPSERSPHHMRNYL